MIHSNTKLISCCSSCVQCKIKIWQIMWQQSLHTHKHLLCILNIYECFTKWKIRVSFACIFYRRRQNSKIGFLELIMGASPYVHTLHKNLLSTPFHEWEYVSRTRKRYQGINRGENHDVVGGNVITTVLNTWGRPLAHWKRLPQPP